MRPTRSWGAAAAVLSLTIATGCSSTGPHSSANGSATPAPSSTSATSGSFNATDVAFATAVGQMDDQAHRLAALVVGRTAHHDLTSLTAAIAQHHLDLTPMPGWARAGATPRPRPLGLLPAEAFRALSSMHGDRFDDAWLEHAAGTCAAIVALCRQELSHGVNPQARALAARALATQPSLLSRVRHYHDSWMHDDRLGAPENPAPRFSPAPRGASPGPRYSPGPHDSEPPHDSPGPHYSEPPHDSPGPHHSERPHVSSSPHR